MLIFLLMVYIKPRAVNGVLITSLLVCLFPSLIEFYKMILKMCEM